METKHCTKCGEVRELNKFNKKKDNKDGLQGSCKSCEKTYREANRDKRNAHSKTYKQANRDAITLDCIRTRSRKKGLEFNIDLEDIAYPQFCPVFGFKLERNIGRGPAKNSPSVDRIIPELGYVKGNVQILSNKANLMKSDATPEELLMFADWIIKTYRK